MVVFNVPTVRVVRAKSAVHAVERRLTKLTGVVYQQWKVDKTSLGLG